MQTLTLSRDLTLHNLLFYAHSLCLIDKTQKFSLAPCPIYAGRKMRKKYFLRNKPVFKTKRFRNSFITFNSLKA